MVQSRFAEAAECAREALSVARAVGYREAEAIALNALGTALGDSGEVDAGVAYLRESLAIAREEGLEMEEGGAWINISDVLNLAGRTEEALEAALQGLATAYTHDWRTTDWLRALGLGVQSSTSATGTARRRPSRPRAGGTQAGRACYWQTCRAQLALGRGDVERRRGGDRDTGEGDRGPHRAAVRGDARRAAARSCRAGAATSTPRAS